MALTAVTANARALAADLNQIVYLINGTAGYGQPVVLTQLNDASNFALTIKNLDATNDKALDVQDAGGTSQLTVDSAGVTVNKLVYSAVNANIAAETRLIDVNGPTYTMTTTVGTQRFTRFAAPTLAADAARTTTTAATVAIGGAPVASGTGPVTITNTYSFWVEGGASQFDGAVTISTGGLTVAAGGVTVTAGGATVTAGGLTVSAGGATITGNTTLTQGTLTNDAQAVSSTVTWNAGAVAFTHWKANVTDTASAAGSLLLDLQVGGASQFKVSKAGAVTTTGGLTVTGNSTITGTLAVSSAITQNGAAVATLSGTETLTNKVLTSPTITSPAISSPTLSGTVAGTPTWSNAQSFPGVTSTTTITGTGGTVTADTPVLNLTQTWNNAGVAFNAIKVSVTTTANADASNLLQLQDGGTDKFLVRFDGRTLIGDAAAAVDTLLTLRAAGASDSLIKGQLNNNTVFRIDGNGVTYVGDTAATVADVIVAQATAATNAVRVTIGGSNVFQVSGIGKLTFGTDAGLRQTTVGAAGGASALPATPSTYLRIVLNNVEYVIPCFAQA